jgi:HSP20 family protein
MFSKHNTRANEKKQSFFEKLTGVVREDDESPIPAFRDFTVNPPILSARPPEEGTGENAGEGQLAVDIYQTETNIYIQAIPAGVSSDDLNISITSDTVTISGKREGPQVVMPENYLVQELYWGVFSRTIVLPEEIEPSEADAIEKHGLLIIRLPKIDKVKKHRIKVKSL